MHRKTEERESVERLIGRMYRHHLQSTGRLPTEKEKRLMERKARQVAEYTDNKRKRG